MAHGELWRVWRVLGSEQRYSYGISHDLEAGKLTFSLHQALTMAPMSVVSVVSVCVLFPG